MVSDRRNFLGVGKGFVWDRDLVCVSGGCMVWNISLVYSCLVSSYIWNGIHYIISLVICGICVLSLGCYVSLLSVTFIFSPWKLWYGLYPTI